MKSRQGYKGYVIEARIMFFDPKLRRESPILLLV